MSAMASQTASLTIVYSIIHLGPDQRKHQSSAQRASYEENFSIWWRHHVESCPLNRIYAIVHTQRELSQGMIL